MILQDGNDGGAGASGALDMRRTSCSGGGVIGACGDSWAVTMRANKERPRRQAEGTPNSLHRRFNGSRFRLIFDWMPSRAPKEACPFLFSLPQIALCRGRHQATTDP
jgi:hypothetical protein